MEREPINNEENLNSADMILKRMQVMHQGKGDSAKGQHNSESSRHAQSEDDIVRDEETNEEE